MKATLKKWYLSYKKSAFKWRCLDNLMPTIHHHLNKPSLSGEEARILRELNEKGIAITSVKKLFGDDTLLKEIQTAVKQLEDSMNNQIEEARAKAGTVAEEKTFLVSVLGEQPTLDLESPFVKLATKRAIIQIANSYFGMWTQLRFFNVWHNLANNSTPKRSQLWHRDRDDQSIIKVFLYLKDIHAGNGAMSYAPGTHTKGKILKEPKSFLEPNRKNPRSHDEEMNKVVPEKDWIHADGPEGTLAFVDTCGYHKGGLARTEDRLLFNFMYVSRAANLKEFYQRPADFVVPRERDVAFALSHEATQ